MLMECRRLARAPSSTRSEDQSLSDTRKRNGVDPARYDHEIEGDRLNQTPCPYLKAETFPPSWDGGEI